MGRREKGRKGEKREDVGGEEASSFVYQTLTGARGGLIPVYDIKMNYSEQSSLMFRWKTMY